MGEVKKREKRLDSAKQAETFRMIIEAEKVRIKTVSRDEYGGKWAMAKYIEAVETEDTNVRQEIIDKISKYNEEDLAATWAVFQWLKKQISQ